MHPIFKFLHIAGVVIWVGGMMFAWSFLRPVAAKNLEPPVRLQLWVDVFSRFFPWVWGAVSAILITGLWTIVDAGFKNAPLYWHLMLTLGLVMSAIFVFVYTQPYGQLKAAVAAKDWPAGGAALGRIRQWIGVNLALGALTIATATLGRLMV